MNIRMMFILIAGGIVLTGSAGAQEEAASVSAPDEIFNSIMQTMPDAMKARIDSASAVQRKVHNPGTATTHPLSDDGMRSSGALDAKQATLEKLPASVREQVRRAMNELEDESIERMLQFKEIRNQEQGK